MADHSIKETLEKQLQLLSEYSADGPCESIELASLSESMAELARVLMDLEEGEKGVSNVSTADLVDELSKRQGVEKTVAEPYQDVQIKVNGPAIVLVVID